MRQALRTTLGDPGLSLLFWLEGGGHHVDENGSAVKLPTARGGRAAVAVETASGRVGAIVYDALLLSDPEPVRGAARVIGLERERLTAELRRLVHGVLPDLLIQRGLAAAVEELLDQVPMRTRLSASGADRPPAPVESAGYSVVPEATADATKHSQANDVQVSLTLSPSTLRIEVRDDGAGGACLESGSGLRVSAELPCGS